MTLALFNVLRARVEVSSLSYRPQEEPDAKERLKMIRLSSLIVCASILACAMSQTPTTSSTVMTSTTTAPQPTPTTEPTTMPPTTPPPPQNDYLVKGDGGKVCLRMVANIKVKFDYLNATSNKTVSYNYTLDEAMAVVDEEQSRCSANESQLVLEFVPPKDESDPNYMFFPFIKTTDKAAWKALPVVYNFTVTKEQFDGSDFIGTPVSYTATKDLLSENVDVKGSYRCKSVEDATLNSSSTNYTLNVTVMIVNLQAQPFFDDAKEGGKFGTVSECPADSGKGNKIVPIAVGAALAGLVIVVLIAYLIGRLKSRRQSSYEALS